MDFCRIHSKHKRLLPVQLFPRIRRSHSLPQRASCKCRNIPAAHILRLFRKKTAVLFHSRYLRLDRPQQHLSLQFCQRTQVQQLTNPVIRRPPRCSAGNRLSETSLFES